MPTYPESWRSPEASPRPRNSTGLAYYAPPIHGEAGARVKVLESPFKEASLSEPKAKDAPGADLSGDKFTRLRRSLDNFPRVPLGVFPTPLDPCPRLSEAIGPVEIYVKRDDLTGLAFGGNKVRHIEYVFGDAIQRGATAIISGSISRAGTLPIDLPKALRVLASLE